MSIHPFTLTGSGGLALRGDVHLPDTGHAPLPVVLAVHGFKGFRKWGFWGAVAEAFTGAGCAFVGFDTTHNGVGAGGLEFDEEDLFEKNTWAREEEDLGVVSDAVRGGGLPAAGRLDPDRIALLGHSRGGGLVVCRAAADEQVRCTVALAPIASTNRYPEAVLREGLVRGFVPIVNTRTGQVLKLGSDAIREVTERTDLHDIAGNHAARLSSPLLVCHGLADPAVSPDDGRRLAEAAPDGEFLGLPETDHVLNCRHPFQGATAELRTFLDRATAFVTAQTA